jgi:methyl-accepting chemotaxis protein
MGDYISLKTFCLSNKSKIISGTIKKQVMKKINDIKIGRRLNLILSLVMFVIITSIGMYIIREQKNKIIADTDLRMNEQVQDLCRIIEIQTEKSQTDVIHTLNIAKKIYNDYKEKYDLQQKSRYRKKASYLNVITSDNSYVDEVSQLTGGTVISIFAKTVDGYKRVSTSLKNESGQRITGTIIPGNSDVAQTLNNNQKYTGRTIIINDWYITSYLPLEHNNEIVGAIGVGIKEKDLKGLRKIFAGKKYFETGYPFIVDSDGNFIIHPTKEGQNEANAEFFKQLIHSLQKSGKTRYTWEGREKFQYFQYAPSIDSYVSASIYVDELMDIIHKVRNAILIAVVLGIGIFALVINVIVKSITSALQQGVEFAESISNGNLNNVLNIDQKDEVGQLANTLNNMVTKLKEIVGGILTGANNVSTASQQMSSTSEQISEGANEQASSVEEVSSTMEQIAANIEQNTMNAQQTEKVSTNLQEGIEKVNDKSRKSVDATRIITEKIKIINDIAFQTNLLALNAAVEAARAGEYGKGFAVVAAEVRKLAERSKIAADEIVELAANTLTLVEGAGNQLSEMLPEVNKTVKLVQEITAASIEQNNGANQINNAIQQLTSVTQQNASASEEMASSSEELAAQAEQLQDLVEFFHVDEVKTKKAKKVKKTNPAKGKKKSKQKKNNKETKKGINIKLADKDNDDHEFEAY